ncbi:unnamed protein product (macronuclear) [Paramecium tetraurelia]|uniref:Chromosome undetermined scaffold_1, whole genome shotgun sequence n=1 Tax=Paramecium tetraurelia TaxID=5888 RepID=Q6BGC0_PARTE|nr:hypothetical protein [Paramecium tetraurelia strain d4-2]XP_001423401.1 uncharacterized protein GSPATT00000438001 [Paramecium tetraurelia]CAH03300.1 hypothetical protein PTMB.103c [Paramecium tetraurelia]CAK56003.1 unnamed protein product [Paramecium tetraurelia]|eukprot:XP_001423401.1 hypothetical protein (macronuclear) [Paramecium tetraurelia strain d4-2]
MILSERNKPNMLLHRKYKQISLSQVLKKPLIIKSLPPILVMSVQKPLKSNKQKSENFQSQRLSQPSILNKFNGLGAVGQSYTPIEKYLIQQQIVLMNSKKIDIQDKAKQTSYRKINVKPLQIITKKCCTEEEIRIDKLNKWSQTTFDEDQLLEYLNN